MLCCEVQKKHNVELEVIKRGDKDEKSLKNSFVKK